MTRLASSSVTRPTVSIGLPVYNGDDYLSETIDSILAQTLTDFELIICDNASTDRTQCICEAYAEKDSRIRYFRQPKNMGAAVNYNTAWQMSRGKYWRWAAHDDPIAPTYLERCVEVMERDPDVVLVHPGTVIIDAQGNEVQCYIDRFACDSDNPVKRFERWMIPGVGQCNPFFALLRPEAVATTGLHPDYPASDRVFIAEMTLRGKCVTIPEGLFYRRIHPHNSVVANPDIRDLKAWFTGSRPKGLTFKQNRLTLGLLSAVNKAPLTFFQKLQCWWIVARWTRPYRRKMLREILIPIYMNDQPTALAMWLSGLPGLEKLRQP